MAKRTVLARIDDMLDMIEEIELAISAPPGAPPRMAKLAMERAFSILSEASRHIPDELKGSEPGIPWRDIAGIGNVLRHDYQRVSDDVLRNAAAHHLTALREALFRLRVRLPE